MAKYLTLQEVKSHCNVDFIDDDIYLDGLTDMVEEMVIYEIQGQAAIRIKGTVKTVGTTALVGTSTNFKDFLVGDIIHVRDETQRTITVITDDTHLTVSIAFTNTDTELPYIAYTGIPSTYDGTFPLALKHAMLIMIAHYYEHREPLIVGVGIKGIPYSFRYLINPFKHFTIR